MGFVERTSNPPTDRGLVHIKTPIRAHTHRAQSTVKREREREKERDSRIWTGKVGDEAANSKRERTGSRDGKHIKRLV